MNDLVRCMREGNEYQGIDIAFPLVAAFLDLSTSRIEGFPIASIHVTYTDHILPVIAKDLLHQVRRMCGV